ncbi:hypothetical protein Tco_1236758, partial [Tanacetum coccineum]
NLFCSIEGFHFAYFKRRSASHSMVLGFASYLALSDGVLCGYLPTCPRGSFMIVVKPALFGCVSMTWYSMFIVLVSGCVPTVVSSGIVPLCMCLSDRNPAKGVVEEHNLLLTLYGSFLKQFSYMIFIKIPPLRDIILLLLNVLVVPVRMLDSSSPCCLSFSQLSNRGVRVALPGLPS